MRRRELLAALGGAVAAWPMVARAQLQLGLQVPPGLSARADEVIE